MSRRIHLRLPLVLTLIAIDVAMHVASTGPIVMEIPIIRA
jgi:hypothetical protein